MSNHEDCHGPSGKGEELRRLEYFELARRDGRKSSMTYVPDPISISGFKRLFTNTNSHLDNKLGIYKTCNGKLRIIQECPPKCKGIRSLNFSNDGEIVILGYYAGGLQGVKASDGSLYAEFLSSGSKSCPITCIRCNPNPSYNNVFYATGAEGNIKICFLTEDSLAKDIIKEKNNDIYSLDIDKTGSTLISGGKDAKIRLYDTETHKLKTLYSRKNINDNPEDNKAPFHGMRIFVVRYHPDNGNVFVSGGWESLVKIWDVRTPTGCVHTIMGPHICGETVDVKINTVLTGSFMPNEGLQVWDLRTAKRIKACNPEHAMRLFEGQFISAAQFFHDDPLGDVIISANVGVKALDIISLKLNAVLYTYTCFEPVSAVQSNNAQIAFGDVGHRVYIGNFNIAGSLGCSN